MKITMFLVLIGLISLNIQESFAKEQSKAEKIQYTACKVQTALETGLSILLLLDRLEKLGYANATDIQLFQAKMAQTGVFKARLPVQLAEYETAVEIGQKGAAKTKYWIYAAAAVAGVAIGTGINCIDQKYWDSIVRNTVEEIAENHTTGTQMISDATSKAITDIKAVVAAKVNSTAGVALGQ